MKYILIFFISFFSLGFGLFDPDPPQCTDGLGHVRHRYLYSLKDTTGLTYSFDTTFQDRRDENSVDYSDTIEWLVIPAGWDTLVWRCARCDSIQYEPSDTVRQIARIMEEVKVDLTPDAVNWGNVEAESEINTTNLKITGIDENITLKIEYTGTKGAGTNFYLYKGSASNGVGHAETSITSSGQEIEITKEYYVYFRATCGLSENIDLSVTVKNASDGNTTLDTFTIRATCEGGGGEPE